MVATKPKKNGKPKAGPAPETHPLLIEVAEALAGPVDLDALVEAGVLRKAGGGWYEVADPDRLPEGVRYRIKAVKSRNRVKFRKANKRARRFLRSLEPAATPA